MSLASQGDPEPSIAVTVGATVELRRAEGVPLEVTGKAAVLVAMVGLEGRVARHRLAELLWPGSMGGQARNNLRTLVHRLNHASISSVIMCPRSYVGK